MRWRTTTPSGSLARASRTFPSTAARRPLPGQSRRAHPRAGTVRDVVLSPRVRRRRSACTEGRSGTGRDLRCSYPAKMKVAVISDIHSNRHAFEATLEAVAASDAAELWCLGDLVGYGAEPDACVELAREHAAV